MEAVYPVFGTENKSAGGEGCRLGGRCARDGKRPERVRILPEDVFDRRLREDAKEAVYAERMAVAVRQARKDIEEGRCIEGTSEVLAAIRQKAKPMACRMVYAERFIDDASRV